MEREKAIEAKVGVFVFLMLAITMVVILLLGKESRIFEAHVGLRTAFSNISGLKEGAAVRLSGIDIGMVRSIRLPETLRERNILVEMKIKKDVLKRIRADSVAKISSVGLLGDKIIDITMGKKGKPLPENGYIVGIAPPDYLSILESGRDVLNNIKGATAKIDSLLKLYSDPQLAANINKIARAIGNILHRVAHGPGLAHSLIYKKTYELKLGRMMEQLTYMVNRFGRASHQASIAISHLGKIFRQVRTGKGLLSTLIYSKKGRKIMSDLTTFTSSIAHMASKVQKGKGLLSRLIYSDKGKDFVNAITAAGKGLRDIVAKIQEGRGTLGALIADPTVYEDLKSILGNLKRHRILRALIRFALKKTDRIKNVGRVLKPPDRLKNN